MSHEWSVVGTCKAPTTSRIALDDRYLAEAYTAESMDGWRCAYQVWCGGLGLGTVVTLRSEAHPDERSAVMAAWHAAEERIRKAVKDRQVGDRPDKADQLIWKILERIRELSAGQGTLFGEEPR